MMCTQGRLLSQPVFQNGKAALLGSMVAATEALKRVIKKVNF